MKKKIEWSVKRVKIEDLRPHPENPRRFTEKGMKDLEKSINSIGFAQPVNINTDGTILSGHARIEKLKQMGETEVDAYEPDRTLTPAQEKEVIIRMNANTAGEWDLGLLNDNFDVEDLKDWGLDFDLNVDDLEVGENCDGDTYTNKVCSPLYSPSENIPEIKELYDISKTEKLISEINKSDIKDEIKEFLRIAAQRHTIINFRLVADYYSNADKDVQELMENSALVIIDFNKAIELGYVLLNDKINDFSDEEKEDECS